jgi:hypothetical protein
MPQGIYSVPRHHIPSPPPRRNYKFRILAALNSININWIRTEQSTSITQTAIIYTEEIKLQSSTSPLWHLACCSTFMIVVQTGKKK